MEQIHFHRAKAQCNISYFREFPFHVHVIYDKMSQIFSQMHQIDAFNCAKLSSTHHSLTNPVGNTDSGDGAATEKSLMR